MEMIFVLISKIHFLWVARFLFFIFWIALKLTDLDIHESLFKFRYTSHSQFVCFNQKLIQY
jgi:hypothetical protein